MSAKILIIDHNDSFTYNLVQLLEVVDAEYVAVCPFNNIDENEVTQCDGIILSPGPGLPKEYPLSLKIIKTFYKTKPILGVCLGMEMIWEHFGGELINLQKVQHGKQIDIFKANECSLFNGISFPMKVGLYHSWAIDSSLITDEIMITSVTKENIPMSLKHRKYHTFGVQFHPESYMTKKGFQLMKNWFSTVCLSKQITA